MEHNARVQTRLDRFSEGKWATSILWASLAVAFAFFTTAGFLGPEVFQTGKPRAGKSDDVSSRDVMGGGGGWGGVRWGHAQQCFCSPRMSRNSTMGDIPEFIFHSFFLPCRETRRAKWRKTWYVTWYVTWHTS